MNRGTPRDGVEAPEPHVFLTADTAYKAMCREGRSQSVVITGESGSGKTETTKIAMQVRAERRALALQLHAQRAAALDKSVSVPCVALTSNACRESFCVIGAELSGHRHRRTAFRRRKMRSRLCCPFSAVPGGPGGRHGRGGRSAGDEPAAGGVRERKDAAQQQQQSRFGKLIEIYFDRGHHICGALIQDVPAGEVARRAPAARRAQLPHLLPGAARVLAASALLLGDEECNELSLPEILARLCMHTEREAVG